MKRIDCGISEMACGMEGSEGFICSSKQSSRSLPQQCDVDTILLLVDVGSFSSSDERLMNFFMQAVFVYFSVDLTTSTIVLLILYREDNCGSQLLLSRDLVSLYNGGKRTIVIATLNHVAWLITGFSGCTKFFNEKFQIKRTQQ